MKKMNNNIATFADITANTVADITTSIDNVLNLKPYINNINFEDILIDINTRLDDVETRLKLIETILEI